MREITTTGESDGQRRTAAARAARRRAGERRMADFLISRGWTVEPPPEPEPEPKQG